MIYEFMATQDLHGYDKPWAPGTGKNLLSDMLDDYLSQVWIGATGEETTLIPAVTLKDGILTDPEQTAYTLTTFMEDASFLSYSLCEYDDSTFIVRYNKFGSPPFGNTRYITSTLNADTDNLRVSLARATGGSVPITQEVLSAYKLMLTPGNTVPTSFEPYANICMPEGFNIWDPENAEYVQIYAGYVNANTRELYLRPVYEEYAGEELVGPWMSSMDAYSEEATPTTGAFVIDFGGELTSFEITPFMLQTLLDSLGIRQHFTDGAGLLNSLMDQAQGRVRSEEELLHLSRPLKVIALGGQLPAGLKIRPISKDVLPGLPGKFIR